MDNIDKILDAIESLYPTPDEYSDNDRFFYWMDYACELDSVRYNIGDPDQNSYINQRLQSFKKDSAEHDALTDVASTLEELYPTEYKGAFVYE